ncbi:MAG: FliO/MopB family protein [Inquilinaceae bacterium]
MEMDTYLRFLLALVFVVALILVISWIVRRFGVGGAAPLRRGKTRRLAVEETLALDAKRRLILIRRDHVEHLLILGPTGERVIETIPADTDSASVPNAKVPNAPAVPAASPPTTKPGRP